MYPFHLTYNLSPFSLHYFFNSKFSLISFLQFVFVKCFNTFFTLMSLITYVYGTVFFNFFNQKNFFRTIQTVTFCKNVFIFWNSNSITNLKFRIFIISFFTRFNIFAWFHIKKFHFNCALICIVTFIHYII